MLRALRAQLQKMCGYSDPYFDLLDIARRAKSDLFVDIGCHTGETLQRFMETGITGRVVAFDPLEQNLKMAKALLSAYSGIEFHQTAISDSNGMAKFYLNKNEQTSSLLENDEGNRESFSFDTALECEIEVPMTSLDSFFSASQHDAIVIKCDTQGAEALVVQGGINLFKSHVAAFYGEVMLGDMYKGQASFDELRHLLEKECGMVLKNIYPCLHNPCGQAVQMDALWVKPEYL